MKGYQEDQRRKQATKIETLKELLRPRVEGPYKLIDDEWFECVYCHKGIREDEGKPRDIVHRDSCWLLAAREALASM